jgi:hypothetical protein
LRPCGAALALVLLACTPEEPGPIRLHRLSRAEYTNSLRDLLGVVPTRAAELPADDPRHGFDNNGDSLTLSPLLLELIERSNDHTIAAALDPSAPHRAPPARLRPCPARPPRLRPRPPRSPHPPRAWRRPLRPEEQKDLLARFDAALTLGADFDAAIAHLLHTIFASPYFLYRVERRAPDRRAPAPQRPRARRPPRRLPLEQRPRRSPPRRRRRRRSRAPRSPRSPRPAHAQRPPRRRPRRRLRAASGCTSAPLDHVFKDTSRYPDFDAPLRDGDARGGRPLLRLLHRRRTGDLRGPLDRRLHLRRPPPRRALRRPAPRRRRPRPRRPQRRPTPRPAHPRPALLSALARPFRTSPSLRGALDRAEHPLRPRRRAPAGRQPQPA